MTKSKHTCPACRATLLMDAGGDGTAWITLWCGFGPCQSEAANNGAEAATEDEALLILARNIEAEECDASSSRS